MSKIISQSRINQLLQKASAGDRLTQSELGRRFYWGIGVEKNESEGKLWFSRAANQGYSRFIYALILEKEGFINEAIELYKSCKYDPKAMIRLAGLSNNEKEKTELYQHASKIYYSNVFLGIEEGGGMLPSKDILAYSCMVNAGKVVADEKGKEILEKAEELFEHDDSHRYYYVHSVRFLYQKFQTETLGTAQDALRSIGYELERATPHNEELAEKRAEDINEVLDGFESEFKLMQDLPSAAEERIKILFNVLRNIRDDHIWHLRSDGSEIGGDRHSFETRCHKAIEDAESDLKNTRDLGEHVAHFFKKLIDGLAKIIGKSTSFDYSSKSSRLFNKQSPDIKKKLSGLVNDSDSDAPKEPDHKNGKMTP